jgi:metallo-beta-lactamase class B
MTSTKNMLVVVISIVMTVGGLCAQRKPLPIVVRQIAEDVYVHTSYSYIGDDPFPSNGLIVSTSEGILLVDTGWGKRQTAQILSWVDSTLRRPVVLCIVTHFHDDRVGGVQVLHDRAIPVLSTKLTASLAPPEDATCLRPVLPDDSTFVLGQTSVRVFYPGEGHTKDNIVVWFPESRILVGGCLVKSLDAKGLGFIDDANLKEWPATVRRMQKTFEDPAIVIPGHQNWGGKELLSHTLELLEKR